MDWLSGAGHDELATARSRSCGSTTGRRFLTAGLVITWNVTNYVLTSYVPTYLTSTPLRYGEKAAPTRSRRPRCRSGSALLMPARSCSWVGSATASDAS
ncbi:MFS transporter [Pseudonocardia sp. MCCB 268]|nr:MFS transporter [Pseudonocardia cytotoxica]